MRRAGLVALAFGMFACGVDHPPAIVGPNPLRFAAGAFDRATGELLIYTPGNDAPEDPSPDSTWAFDGDAWSRRDLFGPPSREGPGVAYDEARGTTLMFGGERFAAKETVADTFVLEGARWRQLDVGGPASRHTPAMAYDPARGGTWMYGGFESCTAAECQALWFFDGRAWRKVD